MKFLIFFLLPSLLFASPKYSNRTTETEAFWNLSEEMWSASNLAIEDYKSKLKLGSMKKYMLTKPQMNESVIKKIKVEWSIALEKEFTDSEIAYLNALYSNQIMKRFIKFDEKIWSSDEIKKKIDSVLEFPP